MADNGYDISDYQDVDPLFGSLEQLDELIAALHARGMKLVMDLVVNHTSYAHAWFAESRSSTRQPQARLVLVAAAPARLRRPATPGAEPTNWGSAFSGPAWTYDATTGEYYLHLFAPEQPDLNWENPEVRAGGLRDDALVARPRRRRLPDGRRQPDLQGGRSPPDGRRPTRSDGTTRTATTLVLNGPRIHEFLQEMHREVFAGRPAGLLNVGETPGCPVEQALLYTDPARGELDMVFQFEHVDLDSGPRGKWDIVPMTMLDLKQSLGRWQDGLADVGWNSLYLGNHDQPRCVSRFGNDDPEHREQSAKALATVLHLHRGTPYVYQGDELGMPNVGYTSIDQLRDIESLNQYAAAVAAGDRPAEVMGPLRAKARDNARAPMQWDASTDGGLHRGRAVARPASRRGDGQRGRPGRRPGLGLRALPPADRAAARGARGRPRLVPDAAGRPRAGLRFVREHDGTRLLVVANLSDTAGVVPDLTEAGSLAGAEPLVLSLPASRLCDRSRSGAGRPARPVGVEGLPACA